MKKKARIILLLIIVLAILLSGLIYYLNKVSKVDHDDIKNNGVLNLRDRKSTRLNSSH